LNGIIPDRRELRHPYFSASRVKAPGTGTPRGLDERRTPSETLTIGYDSDPAPQGNDPLLYGAGTS
jgi:hypothetical protein